MTVPLLISNSPNLATFAPGNTFPSLERGGRITVPPAVPAKVRRDVKGVSEDDITRDLATLAAKVLQVLPVAIQYVHHFKHARRRAIHQRMAHMLEVLQELEPNGQNLQHF